MAKLKANKDINLLVGSVIGKKAAKNFNNTNV